MQTRLTNPTTGDAMPMLNAYEYDQLNRLKASRSFETGLSGNVWNPLTYSNEYYNAFDFDAMGNILYQQRHKRNGDVNHLGKVLTVYSDVKIPLDDDQNGAIDGYLEFIRNCKKIKRSRMERRS